VVEIITKLFLEELDQRGMTEAKLAEMIGVNQGTVNKYVKNRVQTPPLSNLDTFLPLTLAEKASRLNM
jgi:predicted transcriptional regulator